MALSPLFPSPSPSFLTRAEHSLSRSLLPLLISLTLFSFLPADSYAQLRDLEIKREQPPDGRLPVLRHHRDQAAVIIYSSIPNLQFSSNTGGIVEDLSRPEDGRYVLIISPHRQTFTVRAQGFREARFRITTIDALEVAYFSVEPKEPEPVAGRGSLILNTIPEGARITVDGLPDFEQQTPYMLADWAAQSYRIRLELDKYEPMELVVTILEGRTLSRTLELIPDHGFVVIEEEGTLRVQHHSEGSFTRTSYTAGQPLELPTGRHLFQLERDNYETERDTLVINPGETTTWEVSLTPTYGFLVVTEPGDLRIRYDGEGSLSRLEHTAGRRLQLPAGRHELELRRDYYETEATELEINPGTPARWQPASRSQYGRLLIRANTGVRVEVEDNFAPEAPARADYTFVEAGRKDVRITAQGYVAEEFTVDMPPGGEIDTTLTLMSLAEAEDLERRRAQPRGAIMAAADIASTEIWINGEMVGRGFANHTVVTGRHEVEFRHPTGTHRRSVYVAPAEMEHVFTELRPSRARAITLSVLLPGSGHLYTDRSRGYLYGTAFLGAAAGTFFMWQRYDTQNTDYNAALDAYETARSNYEEAGSMEAAARYRDEMHQLYHTRIPALHDDRSEAFDYFSYAVIGTAAIYAINMLDILISRPAYGYRTGTPPEGFSVRAVPAGGGPVSASLAWRISF